jgi:hypothetical protein
MGKAKQQQEEVQVHTLKKQEFDYLKILNTALTYNVLKDKIISGFLYTLCNNRFGYPDDMNLQFELDLEDDKMELKVRQIPQDLVEKAIAQSETVEG